MIFSSQQSQHTCAHTDEKMLHSRGKVITRKTVIGTICCHLIVEFRPPYQDYCFFMTTLFSVSHIFSNHKVEVWTTFSYLKKQMNKPLLPLYFPFIIQPEKIKVNFPFWVRSKNEMISLNPPTPLLICYFLNTQVRARTGSLNLVIQRVHTLYAQIKESDFLFLIPFSLMARFLFLYLDSHKR